MNDFAAWFIQARKSANFSSQAEFAQTSGLSPRVIADIDAGRKNLSRATKMLIAAALVGALDDRVKLKMIEVEKMLRQSTESDVSDPPEAESSGVTTR